MSRLLKVNKDTNTQTKAIQKEKKETLVRLKLTTKYVRTMFISESINSACSVSTLVTATPRSPSVLDSEIGCNCWYNSKIPGCFSINLFACNVYSIHMYI